MSRVMKCLLTLVASIVGAGWAYDAHRTGLACAFGTLACLFLVGLLPAADADARDWRHR